MKLLEFISLFDRRKIEEGKICFKIFALGQKFWFYCEPGTSYEDFINGELLGEGGCLHDLELPEDIFCEYHLQMAIQTYNEDGTPNEVSFEIRCDE